MRHHSRGDDVNYDVSSNCLVANGEAQTAMITSHKASRSSAVIPRLISFLKAAITATSSCRHHGRTRAREAGQEPPVSNTRPFRRQIAREMRFKQVEATTLVMVFCGCHL